jgi:hypothetical protein
MMRRRMAIAIVRGTIFISHTFMPLRRHAASQQYGCLAAPRAGPALPVMARKYAFSP